LGFGLDSNILCYALDPAFQENLVCRRILLAASAEKKLGVNPTVVHETYHTLVFHQKWSPSEARQRILTLLQHPYLEFYSQTRRISVIGLDLARRLNLGGRDSLILANYVANEVPVLYSHDDILTRLQKVSWKTFIIRIEDPLRQPSKSE